MRKIILVGLNIRSAHNVGSLIRTAEGLGVENVYLSGYTPYPIQPKDERLPYLALKIDYRIKKTSLGAENSINVTYKPDIVKLISSLKKSGYQVVALEQAPGAVALNTFRPAENVVLLAGNEVEGLDRIVLDLCDVIVEIPMFGKKESFN